MNDTGKQIDDTGGSGLFFSRINILAAIQSLDTTPPNITIINPPNNTARTNITFLVNVTADEVLHNATLEINSTNFTMSGSGTRWNINISSLINGTYTYKIYANDAFGNNALSETFTIIMDLIPPYSGGNATNFSNSRKNDGVQFNITWNDTVGLSGFIFSWNDTGLFDNLTLGSLNGASQQLSLNKTITATRGNVVGYKFYVNDSAGNINDTETWVITIANTAPSAVNVSINSSDFLNRTNGTLSANWTFTDIDNDGLAANETKWYKNGIEDTSLRNLTSISAANTTKNDIWNFSISVYDGFDFSDFVNASITIRNAKPELNLTVHNEDVSTITINETQLANITTNASDIDNDQLNFTINDTRFNLTGIYFTWATNLSDSGTFTINVTVNDSADIDSRIITLTVLDSEDLDNDGNPDFSDTDDDNDNIADADDFVVGNASNINSSSILNLTLTINGTTNVSKLFNGTFPVKIRTNLTNSTNGTFNLVEFEYNFNSSNILDFSSITTNYTIKGFSGASIRGITRPSSNFTKNFTIEKINTTVDAVCIKDADAGFDTISSACSGSNEFLINCNNQTSSGYTCFDTGTTYKITGLNHSAVKELCVDSDGDGYGTGCALGSDCNDNSFSSTNTCSSGDSGGTGGSGGSSGGGGGGGGGGVSYTCNMDWSCGEWSECDGSWETRECNFIKVSQHTQKERCPTADAVPETARKCSIAKEQAAFSEEGKEESSKTEPDASAAMPTGAAIAETGSANLPLGMVIISSIIIIGLVAYFMAFFRRK